MGHHYPECADVNASRVQGVAYASSACIFTPLASSRLSSGEHCANPVPIGSASSSSTISAAQAVLIAGEGGLARQKLRAAIAFITTNLGTPLRLDDIASAAGVSPFHFARLFRRSTGVSPHRYVTIARIERAKWLLRATPLSIAQVAFECGFASQSYLTTVFRRHVGVTPRTFRTAS
jgi:transcriptional regulator GlxA family with amidase domain